MELKSIAGKLFSAQPSTAGFAMPATVFEVEPGFVAGARLEKGSGRIRRLAVRELEAGSVVPTAHRPNISNPEALDKAIRGVAGDLGGVTSPLGLLLPDSAIRLSLLSFETLPTSPKEQDGLIRWKLKDMLPFAPEEARLSYEVYPAAGKGVEVAALVSRDQVVREYEAAFEPLAGGVRLILPASSMLLPLLPKGAGGSDLLLHICGTTLVAALVYNDKLRLWRYQALENGASGSSEEIVSREAARVIASAADHLGIEIARVWLCARPPATREIAPRIAAATAIDLQILACAPEAGASLSREEKVFLDRYAIPFAGLAAQGRA